MDLLRRSINFGQAVDLDNVIVFLVLLSNLLASFRTNVFVFRFSFFEPIWIWFTELMVCVWVVISLSIHLRAHEQVRRLMQHPPHHTAGNRHLIRNLESVAMRSTIALAVGAAVP